MMIQRSDMKHAAFACVAAVLASCAGTALGQPILDIELLAKAQPDECYAGIGVPYPPGAPECPEGGVPKVNEAYVWGLTKSGDMLWWGTGPNVHCLVMGGYLGSTTPVETESFVCEFGESQIVQEYPTIPPAIGDWRPPAIYSYNLQADDPNEALVERTFMMPPLDIQRLASSTGIRSAGAFDNVAILGGPSLLGGINLFAFHADTGQFISSVTLPQYTNIRQWIVADGALYCGVRLAEGGGGVLRWVGDACDPHQYELVGILDAEAANLTVHEGRLFATTWPQLGGGLPAYAGLYMSPELPPGGLTAAHSGLWEKVWSFDMYEPDPVVALTYGGGDVASFGDYVYWGSMHVPLLSATAWFYYYGTPEDPLDQIMAMAATHRAISIFRGHLTPEGTFEAELLYGYTLVSVYNEYYGLWFPAATGMGPPLYGGAGFDNLLNNYTWTMQVHEGRLYVGTMDFSYLAVELAEQFGIPPELLEGYLAGGFGADVWRFDSPTGPAVAESLDGLGNYANYGVRTMVAGDGLYCGSANPMNLMTDPEDEKPEGGWELLRLTGAAYPRIGDLNCDGVVDYGDIDPFVLALSGKAAYEGATPACNWHLADINGDGNVDYGDIDAFVALLSD